MRAWCSRAGWKTAEAAKPRDDAAGEAREEDGGIGNGTDNGDDGNGKCEQAGGLPQLVRREAEGVGRDQHEPERCVFWGCVVPLVC